MTKDQFIEYIKQPSLLDENTANDLKQLISHYPYFPVVRMLYLRNLKNINSFQFDRELREQAVFIPDRKVLFRYLNYNEDEEKPFRFINEPGSTIKEKQAVDFNLSDKIDDIIDSYSASFDLQRQTDQEPQMDPDSLVDRFIMENPGKIKQRRPVGKMPESLDEDEKEKIDDGLISETLAEIYMAQGLYDEALKAYEKLSLTIPEKNSYFASQIEKIKNLISKDS
ncbi:MAG: hypothetical protein PF486_15740 [Prolixibacteraceae bacterium]|nr:hypothetical protein [Prolixibacteraceae bacterium]